MSSRATISHALALGIWRNRIIGFEGPCISDQMQGSMWVESEVSRGSKFFAITPQISQSNLDVTLSKVRMQPSNTRTILFVDTLRDTTAVVQRIEELARVVHNPSEVADKDRCPHIDTIVVDDVKVVSVIYTISTLILSS